MESQLIKSFSKVRTSPLRSDWQIVADINTKMNSYNVPYSENFINHYTIYINKTVTGEYIHYTPQSICPLILKDLENIFTTIFDTYFNQMSKNEELIYNIVIFLNKDLIQKLVNNNVTL